MDAEEQSCDERDGDWGDASAIPGPPGAAETPGAEQSPELRKEPAPRSWTSGGPQCGSELLLFKASTVSIFCWADPGN